MDFLLREYDILGHLHLASLLKLCVRALAKLESTAGLFTHMVDLFVLEAGLTHAEVASLLPRDLFRKLELWHVLDLSQWLGKRVKVLETVLVGVIYGKGWPFHL